MKLKTLLSFSALIVFAFTSSESAPLVGRGMYQGTGVDGPQPVAPTGIRIYDSTGKFVGADAFGGLVIWRLNDAMFGLRVAKNSVSAGLLLFATDNCTGTPYFENKQGLYAQSAILGTSLFLDTDTNPVETITLRSSGAFNGDINYCTGTIQDTRSVRRPLEIPHFTEQFTPPFSLR